MSLKILGESNLPIEASKNLNLKPKTKLKFKMKKNEPTRTLIKIKKDNTHSTNESQDLIDEANEIQINIPVIKNQVNNMPKENIEMLNVDFLPTLFKYINKSEHHQLIRDVFIKTLITVNLNPAFPENHNFYVPTLNILKGINIDLNEKTTELSGDFYLKVNDRWRKARSIESIKYLFESRGENLNEIIFRAIEKTHSLKSEEHPMYQWFLRNSRLLSDPNSFKHSTLEQILKAAYQRRNLIKDPPKITRTNLKIKR